ncbi:MAG: SRPBCC domain-containing protein [Caulobacteraceae bacterium]
MSEDLVVETDLQATPEKVWEALSEPGRWLIANDLPADKFSVADAPGAPDCEVIESRPPSRLAVTWRTGGLDSIVTFDLTEIPDGTRLRIVHSGLRAANTGATVMKWAA